jgi:hypothetical protein
MAAAPAPGMVPLSPTPLCSPGSPVAFMLRKRTAALGEAPQGEGAAGHAGDECAAGLDAHVGGRALEEFGRDEGGALAHRTRGGLGSFSE